MVEWNTNVLFCLCLLVVILIVLQVFVVTSFKIPSDSMEPSLLAGDCILVDKCSGGARLFNVLDAVEKKEVKDTTYVRMEKLSAE